MYKGQTDRQTDMTDLIFAFRKFSTRLPFMCRQTTHVVTSQRIGQPK
jgi:hypothetical protein